MRNKVGFFVLFVVFSMLISFNIYAAPYINIKLNYDNKTVNYNAEDVYLYVNGEKVTDISMPPIILDGYTLVPAREVFEKLGASVAWKGDKREIDILFNNTFVVMFIDSNVATVSGYQVPMSAAPKIINGKTMIPLRFVAESIGMEVEWDNNTRIASIKDPALFPTTDTTTESTTQTQVQITTSNQNTSSKISDISIDEIVFPDSSSSAFQIIASGKIDKYETSKLPDGRLFVDIYNAENNIAKELYEIDHPYVSSVRIGQNQTEPSYITRIVLDMKEEMGYKTELFDNGRSLSISFEESLVNDIDLSYDTIKISSSASPVVEMTRNGGNLVAYVKNAKLDMNEKNFGETDYVKDISYSQYDLNTVQVVIGLKDENLAYKINKGSNFTEIKLSTPPTKNLYYEERRITIKKEGAFINTFNVVHNDDYLNKKYSLTFDSDLSKLLGSGILEVGDDYIESIYLSTEFGKTTIEINEKQVLAYTLTDDVNYLYIDVLMPKEKYKNIVVFDAGHGGKDPGAIANGLNEKDITLAITNKILELFENDDDIKAYSSRVTDVYPTYDDRTDLGNLLGDTFVSIHINSAGSNTSANGTEVYYHDKTVVTAPSGLSSKILAETLQSKLVSYLGSFDRKVKQANFIVLRQSAVPSALCEIGFITNSAEAAKMKTPEYQEKVALAVYDAIKELFAKYPSR